MVVLSHEHLDHIGAAYHFDGRTFIAAHRLAANKIMLRDDFSMLRKMFNEPNVPINVDIWLEEGNLIDLGNFRLNVMHTPGHTSACITLFDQDKGLLFAADTLMPGGVMGGVFGSGSIADYIQSLERLKGLNSKILLSGHGRLSDTPQDDVRIAIQRSHGCCRTPRNCSTRSMRGRISSRSCNRCATSTSSTIDKTILRSLRESHPYITTGVSGSSFGPRPCGGKCLASSRDTASMPLITPRSKLPALKSVSIARADLLPARGADLGVDAAVGDDLDVAVGEQEIDQHAVVVRGVPDAQMRENIERALARRLIAKQRRAVERAFDDEADLAGMRGLAGLDRLLDRSQHVRRKIAPHPPVVLEKMPADAPDAHVCYQLPDAPPPPKLPPPPLKPPLSLELLPLDPAAADQPPPTQPPPLPRRPPPTRQCVDEQHEDDHDHADSERRRKRADDEPGQRRRRCRRSPAEPTQPAQHAAQDAADDEQRRTGQTD